MRYSLAISREIERTYPEYVHVVQAVRERDSILA
jgi:hypothetical protein